tara:strand:- start:753 stop:968 length:216 start_codon:yes stop_codon:yes gene_type:complete
MFNNKTTVGKMKTFFNVVLRETKSRKKISYDVDACDFPTAAGLAYLKRHTLSSQSGEDWHIISLKEHQESS